MKIVDKRMSCIPNSIHVNVPNLLLGIRCCVPSKKMASIHWFCIIVFGIGKKVSMQGDIRYVEYHSVISPCPFFKGILYTFLTPTFIIGHGILFDSKIR